MLPARVECKTEIQKGNTAELKAVVENQSSEMVVTMLPKVVRQMGRQIDLAGDLIDYLSGDNRVNHKPIHEVRDVINYLKQTDALKLTVLKAAGLAESSAKNIFISNVFSQQNTTILTPDVLAALGGALDLEIAEEATVIDTTNEDK